MISALSWIAIGMYEVGDHKYSGLPKQAFALAAVITLPFVLAEQWQRGNHSTRVAWIGLLIVGAVLVLVMRFWP